MSMEVNAASQVQSPPAASLSAAIQNLWQWACRAVKARKVRRLRVCESLSLGERRFFAVIEFDRQEFLVAGTGNSLVLLARLEGGKVVPESPVRGDAHVF